MRWEDEDVVMSDDVYADRGEDDAHEETLADELADDEISAREEGFVRGYRDEREAEWSGT